ncbi:four helix bundle protein [Gloeocapsopsis sp. IPPAS B-1203]|uniref:four helix bundle protein n=1 Tax=Gloeocapsopsis sp. IPPAS B-1203 TaxID=2049454 RepID=UPI000C1A4957|nr:four helix bundle protein [Gloeocapsopsis sp. IPPAS B-1203]PIG92073.1 four helix bundle protein [Gloeocapsopsis sp. IPPAS B-1203]
MSINSYQDLKVWQFSMNLAEKVYHLTYQFPKQETYGLSSQIQRAAVSVPSNIAEGHTRDSTKEYLQFLSVALGSLAELETQLILAERLSYLDIQDLQTVLSKTDEISRMIRGLQKALKAKL